MVEGLVLRILLVLGLILGRVLPAAGLGHHHADGVADVIGILLNKAAEPVFLKEFGVFFIVRIGAESKGNHSAEAFELGGSHGIAVRTGGFPFPRLVGAVSAGYDRDPLADHERRIEAHAELTDYIDLVLAFIAAVLLEIEGAALCNGAEVRLELFLRHAAAVIAHGKGAGGFIGNEADLVIRTVKAYASIRQRAEI